MKNILNKIKKLDRSVLICAIAAILAVILITVLLISTAVKKDKNNNEETPDINSTVSADAETPLPDETTDSTTDITEEFGMGNIDPENDDITEENGSDVTATDIPLQTGRANGIDVSKWQGKIDWQRVKADGIEFAFIRIGYRGENGKIYKDDNADYNIQQATRAGIPVGVYFFSTAINTAEAIEEAEWTARAIEGYAISYPVIYDCEGYKKAESRMHSLSAEKRTANAIAFLETIKDKGYEPMFYASRNDILTSNYWNISLIEKNYKIWIAQYPATTYPQKTNPEYSGKYAAWQYTDKGKVGGINGNVDMVVCYFTCPVAKPKNPGLTPNEATAPLTEEEKIYTSVNEKVTAKALTNLRSAATTKSDIVATLKNGETVTRIGIGTNGWSKLSYNGKTVYAITSYLTTELSPTTDTAETGKETENNINGDNFTPADDRVTAKIEVNLRSKPTTNSDIVAVLKNGEFLSRTGTNDQGWSRLIYNGSTVYAVSSYLTTESTKTEETTGVIAETKPVSDGFKAVDEQVTAKEATNLRTAPSTANSEIVYTLKNGEYIQRIGVHSNGWSKLIYNGQTVYAVSSYLTTETVDTTTEAQTQAYEETTETVAETQAPDTATDTD